MCGDALKNRKKNKKIKNINIRLHEDGELRIHLAHELEHLSKCIIRDNRGAIKTMKYINCKVKFQDTNCKHGISALFPTHYCL